MTAPEQGGVLFGPFGAAEAEPGQAPVMTQNLAGEWVLAIPLPFYGLRKHCGCGRKFWTADGYQGHYALAHILKLREAAQ